jgi:glycosyltransferase involved in cell wall biosynthesis
LKKKTRILSVITSLRIGGAEKLVVDSIPIFKNKGFHVDVFIFHPQETEFSKKLRDNGIHIIKSFKFHIYNPVHVFRTLQFIRKYDIIHVHLFPGLYWVAIAKMLSFSKVKLLYTEHSTSNKRRNNFFKWFDKVIYKQYSKIISISEEVDSLIKDHLKLPETKFLLIRNGINLNGIANAVPLQKDSLFSPVKDEKLIIQVSSFRKQKDQKTLIEALKILSLNIRLILVGDGPLKDDCKMLAQKLGVFERVHFLGLRMDVPRLLKTADIIVLSSNHEGLSLSSIEGLASGKPFIASNVPGLTEIVQGAGLLFPKGDFNTLADHITKLLANRNYYNEITASCLKRSKDYDINTMIDSYITLYSQLVK